VNSLIWKRRIAKCYSACIRKNNTRKIILLYHAVGNSPWAISTDTFRKQIQWLNQHCKITSLTKLLTMPEQEDTIEVALTFDDGYACLYDTILPILQAENAVATVYINTDCIGQCEKTRKLSVPALGHYPIETFLLWDEVRALEKLGWEIGSHGVNHVDLTQQDAETIKNELNYSKLTIQDVLQKECTHFAYTWGKHSKNLRQAVAAAGYRYAVAGHHAVFKKNNNLMALPRLNIEKNYSLHDFENITLGKWDFLGAIQRIKKWLWIKY